MSFRLLLAIFLFLTTMLCFSQEKVNQQKIDSLLVVLNTKINDTTRINTYQVICEQYWNKDANQLGLYSTKLLLLSKKNNYKKGIGFYYLNITLINKYLSTYNSKIAQKARLTYLLRSKTISTIYILPII